MLNAVRRHTEATDRGARDIADHNRVGDWSMKRLGIQVAVAQHAISQIERLAVEPFGVGNRTDRSTMTSASM